MIQYHPYQSNYSKLKRITVCIALSLLAPLTVYASTEQTNKILKFSNTKRIETAICADSMNRITVANDRITQIFGDEGTFESQNDEATGQIFLKPTLQNGSKNLSITLITEQGVTQDLTLKPIAKSAQTIILSRDSRSQDFMERDPTISQGSSDRDNLLLSSDSQLNVGKMLPLQEQLLSLVKQAIMNQHPFSEEESLDSKGISRQLSSREGYSLTPSQSWQEGPYSIHAHLVENVTEASLDLHEQDFYQPGDLALCFDIRDLRGNLLPAQATVTLYVVSYRQRELQ